MNNNVHGEIKARKNIFPSEAVEMVEKRTIAILIIQAIASEKTKSILDKAGITLYEGVEPSEVERLRAKVAKELQTKEKKDAE